MCQYSNKPPNFGGDSAEVRCVCSSEQKGFRLVMLPSPSSCSPRQRDLMTGNPVGFELCSGEAWRDPFPMYRSLRDHDPVHLVAGSGSR